jgi:hypothetical protein
VADTIRDVLNQEQRQLTPVKKETVALLDSQLAQEPVDLSTQFLKCPGRVQIVGTVARLLASWLRTAGLGTDEADATVLTVPARFVACLNTELAEHKDYYQRLVQEFSPQFTAAVETEDAWLRYHVELHTLANPQVLNLGVALDDVYVELRAYTLLPNSGNDGILQDNSRSAHRHEAYVGMLMDLAKSWIEDPLDAIFVISGGPGAGKSAFARRFAAWRAWAGPEPWRVLFVPLHRFKLGTELIPSLNEFACGELKRNLTLFDRSSDDRLFIIFEGLDELAQQGKVGEEAAADFFRQVDDFVKDCNRDSTSVRLKVMLCGRPVAVSSTNAEIRKSERVRHLLPYQIEHYHHYNTIWKGRKELIKLDQRDEWWSKLGLATGNSTMKGMPNDIRTQKLDPLTAEPILNGLIAQCRREHKITPDTNRAQIYEWLLRDVLKRVHDKSGKQHLRDASEDDIARLLEEVAVTAWHNGDVRATTKTKVLDRCEKTEQTTLLNRVFPDRQKPNITSLFLAFYFQESGERQGQDRAFEFSHKSFGEYLIARRIDRFLRELQMRVDEGAWDSEVALKRWVELFGPSTLDVDQINFAKDVLDLAPGETTNSWRRVIIKLISRVARYSLPMNQLNLPTFQAMQRQFQNAIRSFFILHSTCYRIQQGVIPFESQISLRNIDSLGVGIWYSQKEILSYMNGIDLTHADLFYVNFLMAELKGADLSDADIVSSNFANANLNYANLSRCNITSSGFGRGWNHPSMKEEDSITHIIASDFRGANLSQAIFVKAHVSDDTRMNGALVEGANFSHAKISIKLLRTTIGEPAFMPNGKPPKRDGGLGSFENLEMV